MAKGAIGVASCDVPDMPRRGATEMSQQTIARYECTRCHAEVRPGKSTHFCGEPFPNKVHDEIRRTEYVSSDYRQAALEFNAEIRDGAAWLDRC